MFNISLLKGALTAHRSPTACLTELRLLGLTAGDARRTALQLRWCAARRSGRNWRAQKEQRSS